MQAERAGVHVALAEFGRNGAGAEIGKQQELAGRFGA